MNENRIGHDSPSMNVSLAVAAPLLGALDAAGPLREAVRAGVERSLGELLRTMGIPGIPAVEIAELEARPKAELLRLSVDGRLQRYADDLPQRVYYYVKGLPTGSPISPDRLLAWITELSDQQSESAKADLVEFFSLACLEILKRKPSVLLGAAQAEAYRAALVDAAKDEKLPDAELLRPVLAQTLDLKVSIADRRTAAATLAESLARGRSGADAAEDLIAALRPDAVEIQMAPDYFRRITTAMGSENDLFVVMRDGLFYETGLRYPDFRFVPTPNFKPNSFAFKINHLTTLPCAGLKWDQTLANADPEKLNMWGVHGDAAINPVNAERFSVIDDSSRSTAEMFGLTTWSPAGYLVLCFGATLRENGACFVHRKAVEQMLGLLNDAFPVLIGVAQTRFSVEQITRVLRILVSEEISIRNLKSILESLAHFDFIVTDPNSLIVFDERFPVNEPPDEAGVNDPVRLASQARCGLKRYISHKYTAGKSALEAYLLDREIEAMIMKPAAEREEETERFLAALRAERELAPSGVSSPVVLTSIETRTAAREIIAGEHPRLPVIAYQELTPDLNIVPVSKIRLDA
jgi:flagellar biosynthesis component FlhA